MSWCYREFHELTGREVYEMLKLRVDVFIVEQNCAYPEIDGHDYDSIHVFYKDEAGVAAYARLLPAGVKSEDPSIGRVIIRPDVRGTGLAHTLMEKSLHYMANEWRPGKIYLQAQQHLIHFYGTHGFQAVSEPYDEDGIPHVDMVSFIGKNESF